MKTKLNPEREERIRSKHQCLREHILYSLDKEAFACFVCDLLEEVDALREHVGE